MPRNILEAYDEIAAVLWRAHRDKPFRRQELVNELLRSLNVLTESTRAAHIKTMISMGYIEYEHLGTAYSDTMLRLGPAGREAGKKPLSAEQAPAPKKKGGKPRL
jgi:hypothetical protein